jgi:hypothetical protein
MGLYDNREVFLTGRDSRFGYEKLVRITQEDMVRQIRRSDGQQALIAVEAPYWFHYTVN